MAIVPPLTLTIRTRENIAPAEGEPHQIVEVLHGEKVVGQLPITRVAYEMLPHALGKVTLEVICKRSEIESAP